MVTSYLLQLEPGVPLPSPERLKGKILLKDKVKRQKGENKQHQSLCSPELIGG